MIEEPLEKVVRALIRNALDDCPAILARNQRYADFIAQSLAKEDVSDRLVRALAGAGILPPLDKPIEANYFAVSYTIGRMRKRMLRHIKGGDSDYQAVRAHEEAVALAFFTDLEEQGWRLVRTFKPRSHNDQLNPPGFKGTA